MNFTMNIFRQYAANKTKKSVGNDDPWGVKTPNECYFTMKV